MLGGTIRLESDKGKGSRFTVEIPMQTAEELPERINQTQVHHNHTFHDVVAIDNAECRYMLVHSEFRTERQLSVYQSGINGTADAGFIPFAERG